MALLNRTITIHSGPDDLGRYTYTIEYDDDSPAGCSGCGGGVSKTDGIITCTGYPYGSTPERRKGCGLTGRTMKHAQVFHARLPADA
jgi:hypothetical protein